MGEGKGNVMTGHTEDTEEKKEEKVSVNNWEKINQNKTPAFLAALNCDILKIE